MTDGLAYRFLTALGQALSAARLYEEDHPALGRSTDRAWDRAEELLSEAPGVSFTFLEGEVAVGDRRIPPLRDWPWTEELSRAGIERIEMSPGLDRRALGRFLEALQRRLGGEPDAPAAWSDEEGHVHFGPLREGEEATDRIGLRERLDDVGRLFDQARSEGIVSPEVAETVVGEVARAIRRSRNLLKLLVPLKEVDQYSTVHSMNVSVLSIGFAEEQGYQGSDVKRVGESALLHDVGKSLVPEEILQKPASLTDREWEIVRKHPEDGARILLRSRNENGLLPAVVAYEHHMYLDGSGYPPRHYPRDPHPVSQLVQICDIFDALRTRRPFRGPWPADKIMLHLNEGAGTRFHPTTVDAFARMIGAWDLALEEEEAGEADPEASRPESGGGDAGD